MKNLHKTMKYDDVYEYTGQFGIYQICASICLMTYFLLANNANTIIFIAAKMPHWCRVEELTNLSYDLQRYIAIPLDDSGKTDSYDSCSMYAFDYSNMRDDDFRGWNRTIMLANKTRTIPCTEWVYEQNTFVSTIVSRFDLVCKDAFLVPLSSTIYTVGGLIGGLIAGPIADRFGRKITFIGSLGVKILGIAFSIFSPNFILFGVGRFVLGAGSMSCYIVGYILCMELAGPKYRSLIGGTAQAVTSVGFILQPLIAYVVRDDFKFQIAALGGPHILLPLIALVVCESPRWLLVNGRFVETEKIFRDMCAVNGTKLPDDFNIEKIEIDEKVSGSFLLLFKFPAMRMRTSVCSFLCFTGSMTYLSMSLNTGALYGDIFTNTVISASLEIPAIVIAVFLIDWKVLGRRYTSFGTFLLTSICCLLCIPITLMDIGIGETVLALFGKAVNRSAWTALYIFASEIFPTEVRNAGLGIMQLFGGVANMGASFIGEPLGDLWRPLPYVILGGFGVVASFLCLLLPETIGHALQDTVEEAEKFKGGKLKIPIADETKMEIIRPVNGFTTRTIPTSDSGYLSTGSTNQDAVEETDVSRKTAVENSFQNGNVPMENCNLGLSKTYDRFKILDNDVLTFKEDTHL